jgi:hypothetical protein
MNGKGNRRACAAGYGVELEIPAGHRVANPFMLAVECR